MTWRELQEYDMKIVTTNMPRTGEVQSAYDKFKETVNVEQKILGEIYSGKCGYRLDDNKFPYNLPSDISHKVFWMCNTYNIHGLDYVKMLICDMLDLPNSRVVVFANATAVQSVPTIRHYQVFIQQR